MDLSKLSQVFNILNASQNTKMAKVKKVASIKKTQRPVEKRQADALAALYSKFCKDLDNIQVIRNKHYGVYPRQSLRFHN